MASGHVTALQRPNTWPQPTKGCEVQILLANSEPMVWTPPFQPVESRTWTAARENHHAGRSDRLGLGKVRV